MPALPDSAIPIDNKAAHKQHAMVEIPDIQPQSVDPKEPELQVVPKPKMLGGDKHKQKQA